MRPMNALCMAARLRLNRSALCCDDMPEMTNMTGLINVATLPADVTLGPDFLP